MPKIRVVSEFHMNEDDCNCIYDAQNALIE